MDIGGGQRCAVISLGGMWLYFSQSGGNKIDVHCRLYEKTYNLAIGDKTAEDIKIQIGSAVPLDEELSMSVKGRDHVLGLPRTVK